MINYSPINYTKWNFNGQGINILDSLSDIEKLIWKTSLQFQDTREGETGHVEVVTYFALKLNDYLEGDRKITIPAAILHDIGWGQLSQIERDQFYLPNWKDFEPQLRQRHQEKGIKLSEKLLNQINYSPEYTSTILEIISQHDTRLGFLNKNDGIVRDADKLWRFTVPCFKIATQIRKQNPKELYLHLIENIDKEGFFYSDTSREIARIELENTYTKLS